MSEANTDLIHRFYRAFEELDAEAMAACYADDVVFRDPAFGELRGERARNMWRMLCRAATDLSVTATAIRSEGDQGSAHWEADYTFSTTNKPVHNVVDAQFEFRDGRIVRHTDDFDFRRWAGQAFGFVGGVLAYLPVTPMLFQRLTRRQLDAFEAKRRRN